MSKSSGGIGFTGALFLVFLSLKLCGVIDWSWWWVTAPLWALPAALLAFLAFYLVAAAIALLLAAGGR